MLHLKGVAPETGERSRPRESLESFTFERLAFEKTGRLKMCVDAGTRVSILYKSHQESWIFRMKVLSMTTVAFNVRP